MQIMWWIKADLEMNKNLPSVQLIMACKCQVIAMCIYMSKEFYDCIKWVLILWPFVSFVYVGGFCIFDRKVEWSLYI